MLDASSSHEPLIFSDSVVLFLRVCEMAHTHTHALPLHMCVNALICCSLSPLPPSPSSTKTQISLHHSPIPMLMEMTVETTL